MVWVLAATTTALTSGIGTSVTFTATVTTSNGINVSGSVFLELEHRLRKFLRPEPSSSLLILAGLVACALVRRRSIRYGLRNLLNIGRFHYAARTDLIRSRKCRSIPAAAERYDQVHG